MEKVPPKAGYLVITLKEGEVVSIGDLGIVGISMVKGNSVRVGFHFPDPKIKIERLSRKNKKH